MIKATTIRPVWILGFDRVADQTVFVRLSAAFTGTFTAFVQQHGTVTKLLRRTQVHESI
jgi:predicted aminopeptidase